MTKQFTHTHGYASGTTLTVVELFAIMYGSNANISLTMQNPGIVTQEHKSYVTYHTVPVTIHSKYTFN